SAPVKANASMHRLCDKQPREAFGPSLQLAGGASDGEGRALPAAAVLDTPAHVLQRVATRQRQIQPTQRPGSRRPKARLISNKTHYSPT
ncbi:IS1182 family transposase, partial [Hymenobacter sp. HD11105]